MIKKIFVNCTLLFLLIFSVSSFAYTETGITVIATTILPSRTNLGEVRRPIRINPVFKWNGNLWTIIQSGGPTTISFYNLSTKLDKIPVTPIYATMGSEYVQPIQLLNGNLGIWIGAKNGVPGDYYVLDSNLNVLAHTNAWGNGNYGAGGTEGVGTINNFATIVNFVSLYRPGICTHDLQLFQGGETGGLTVGPIYTLPQGNSTCISIFMPNCALVNGVDGKLYIGVIRDSNGHGYADFLRINPLTFALEKLWATWKAIGAERPPIYSTRAGSNIVFSTTNDEPVRSTPFNLAKHPTLLIGLNPDVLSEYVNTNVWVSVYNNNYVASNHKNEPLVASCVYDVTDGSQTTLLNLWRLRGGKYELLYTDKMSANNDLYSFRGIYTESNDIWLAYIKTNDVGVVVQLRDGASTILCPPCPPQTNCLSSVVVPCYCTNATSTITKTVNNKGKVTAITTNTSYKVILCN
jgi:hypothetical protein